MPRFASDADGWRSPYAVADDDLEKNSVERSPKDRRLDKDWTESEG